MAPLELLEADMVFDDEVGDGGQEASLDGKWPRAGWQAREERRQRRRERG